MDIYQTDKLGGIQQAFILARVTSAFSTARCELGKVPSSLKMKEMQEKWAKAGYWYQNQLREGCGEEQCRDSACARAMRAGVLAGALVTPSTLLSDSSNR